MSDDLKSRLRNATEYMEIRKITDCNPKAVLWEAADRIAELERERDQANESWHYANGVAELAMKHRDEAEAKCERLRETLANAYLTLQLIRRGINSGHIKDQTILEPVSEDAENGPMTPLSDMIDRVLARTALAAIRSFKRGTP